MNGRTDRGSPSLNRSRKAACEDRRKKTLIMVRNGYTLAQVGEALGIGAAHAGTLVRRCMADLAAATQEEAKPLRALMAARLDALLTRWLPAAIGGDAHAAGVVLRVLERQARLFGLDAPVQVTGSVAVHEGTAQELAERAVQALLDAGADPSLLARALGVGEVVDSRPVALPEPDE